MINSTRNTLFILCIDWVLIYNLIYLYVLSFTDFDTDSLDTEEVDEEIIEFLVKEETTVLE